MATTTPNYAWVVPTSSDLVKNGATAIETLGDSADESLWNSGYGQAGKNKIINGDYGINQRAFTSVTTNGTYTFDRWTTVAIDGTTTFTPQTFTLGAAPVAGYEGKNFLQIVTTGQTLANASSRIDQRIESVRTFAGQTVTVSFWAKAATGTPKISVEMDQQFGTGGSPSARVATYAGQVTLSTSWARYSVSIAIPSISGKTLGTANDDFLSANFWVSAGSTFNSRTGSLGIQSNTFQIWGVQAEYGSKMTPFQTASGNSIQGELAMCQRYYFRLGGNAAYELLGYAYATNTTVALAGVAVPVSMRVIPTILEYSTLAFQETGGIFAVSSASFSSPSRQQVAVEVTTAGVLTPGRGGRLLINNSTSGYIAFSAEL
jgi:hypothetical protein